MEKLFGISGASVLLCILYGLSQSKAIAKAAGAVESMTIIFSPVAEQYSAY